MFSKFYDKKYLVQCLVWLCVVVGLMKATGGAGFVIAVPMVFYGLLARKTEALFFWLLVSECMLIANPNIATKGAVFAWTQRGLMLSLGAMMAIQVLAFPKHKAIKQFLLMLVYLLFMCLSSIQGWCPIISFLKLILFTVVYFSYFGVANQVGINPRVSSKKIRSVMLAITSFFILGSVALVPFPAISQMKAEWLIEHPDATSLFMGMANHSQSFGPIISSSAVVLFSDLLFSIKKWDPLYLLLLACCPYLIYLTSSRTGMGSFLLSMMFVTYVFMMARGVGSRWKSRALTSIMAVMSVGFIALMCTPGIQDKVIRFVMKSTSSEVAVTKEGMLNSRQFLIDAALYNFNKSPVLGNGFQVAPGMKKMKIRDASSLLTAPVEKGVWATAVLEEGGVVGMAIFLVVMAACIFGSVKRRVYTGASCMFLMLMVNFGEFTMFSMSYTGGYTWAMVFVGLALDLRKMKDENEALRKQMLEQQIAMMRGSPTPTI